MRAALWQSAGRRALTAGPAPAAGYHYDLYNDENDQGMYLNQYSGEYDDVYQVGCCRLRPVRVPRPASGGGC